MLYNFARRYDEYAGEDYDGSSCRGALKGWFHHGVCLESDWPYREQENIPPQYGYAERAVNTTLGVYYRIDIKNITDMQAAIHDVGLSTFPPLPMRAGRRYRQRKRRPPIMTRWRSSRSMASLLKRAVMRLRWLGLTATGLSYKTPGVQSGDAVASRY